MNCEIIELKVLPNDWINPLSLKTSDIQKPWRLFTESIEVISMSDELNMIDRLRFFRVANWVIIGLEYKRSSGSLVEKIFVFNRTWLLDPISIWNLEEASEFIEEIFSDLKDQSKLLSLTTVQ